MPIILLESASKDEQSQGFNRLLIILQFLSLSRSCGSGVGSQQRFRVFLVGRGGREGRALDESRLVMFSSLAIKVVEMTKMQVRGREH